MNGEWTATDATETIPDPLNGEPFITFPATQGHETAPFVEGLRRVPKSGLHNAFKNPERYSCSFVELFASLVFIALALWVGDCRPELHKGHCVTCSQVCPVWGDHDKVGDRDEKT